MGKLVERFRAHKVYNPHEFLHMFARKGETDYAISYEPYEPRTLSGNETKVWAPGRKLEPKPHWMNYNGGKVFTGKRAESRPKAIAWAASSFGIPAKDWVPCPVDSTTLIPRCVRDLGLKWLKRQEGAPATHEPGDSRGGERR